MRQLLKKLDLKDRILVIIFFSLFILNEMWEIYQWGFINAFSLDVCLLSISAILAAISNLILSRFFVINIVVYYLFLLVFNHFPAYPQYQAFTYVLCFININSMVLQKYIHVVFYIILILFLMFGRPKTNRNKEHFDDGEN